ncbi:TIGR02678 family protein [Nocardia sp. NPDC057668]|uniref:TIGR02678 family protein n=1 Tax=Nocardia sp. NPDC057668 TaxID=3346202 RepID=UPI00366A7E04
MTDTDRSLNTRSHDAAALREAARALLRTPIVTAARTPDTLALIRRHATPLRTMFNAQLGYQLTVEASFARLAKLPPEHQAPNRVIARRAGTPFGARTYTLVAMACSALLAPGVGTQILVSQLVAQIRSDAAEQGISFSDSISDRRQLVAALTALIDWGVLTETDGTVAQWSDRDGEEALLTVCRPVLPFLLVRPIGPNATPSDILEPESSAPRRRLRRRLTEDPVVLRADLSPEEVDVLSRERSQLTRLLAENFGLTLEVRAEGALAYDPADSLSDIEFPGSGSLKQAALLLIGALLDQSADNPAEDREFSWATVDSALTTLVEQHSRAWRAEYADSISVLRSDVVALLGALRLATPSEHGLRLHAPVARYRPRTVSSGVQLTLET